MLSLDSVERAELLEANSLYEFLQRFLVLRQISGQRGRPEVFLKNKPHPSFFFRLSNVSLRNMSDYTGKMCLTGVFQTGVPVGVGSAQRRDLHRPQRLSVYILTRVVREGHEEPSFISPLTQGDLSFYHKRTVSVLCTTFVCVACVFWIKFGRF